MVDKASDTLLKKGDFPLWQQLSIANSFLVRNGTMCPLLLRSVTFVRCEPAQVLYMLSYSQ